MARAVNCPRIGRWIGGPIDRLRRRSVQGLCVHVLEARSGGNDGARETKHEDESDTRNPADDGFVGLLG